MSIEKLPLTNLPPVQLWIFDDPIDTTEKQYLKMFFCYKNSACNNCYGCNALSQNQHPNVMHIAPPYILESVNPIKEKIAFLLESDQCYFFIISSAEKLLIATANALLKILEEPPKGYYFILQTNHQEKILPTIASRSVIFNLKSNNSLFIENKFQPLIDHFLKIKPLTADLFLALIDSLEITEQESARILTYLLSKEQMEIQKKENPQISILVKHLSMIDSTTNMKFLWRNLFLETFVFEK